MTGLAPPVVAAVNHVTVTVGGRLFGVPIRRVRDVFMVEALTPVPFAPPEVVGLVNLHGRVATAISLATRLGLPGGAGRVAVAVEMSGELVALVADGFGAVARLGPETRDATPNDIPTGWQALVVGVHRSDGDPIVILDVEAILDVGIPAAFEPDLPQPCPGQLT